MMPNTFSSRRKWLWLLALAGGAGLLAAGLTRHGGGPRAAVLRLPVAYAGPVLPASAPLTAHQARMVKAARAQVGDVYDASYCTLAYPNGDPPRGTGACTDVVIRSLRADGSDSQALVHADMARHWDRYPHRWGLTRPDPNIDHRRVPNLAVFFTRHGRVLPNAVNPKTLPTWQPGDIVAWKLPPSTDHIGVVSDRRDADGVPLVIHNLSRCAEQDVLTAWPIVGHYRYPAKG